MLKIKFIVALLLVTASIVQAKPLDFRVWQLQDYDMPHIKRLIDMAAAQKVNRIQLSHNIVMDVEQPLNSEQLVKDINTICTWAHAKKISVDMWTHELNGIPQEFLKDGKVDLDDPKIWEFVKGKYDKLFKLCPGLDGLVLSMHETDQSIYNKDKVAGSLPMEQRVEKLVDNMAVVCKAFGKAFFVRTFAYEPWELKTIQDGLKLSKSDVIVMSKTVPHDWQPYWPNSPEIGDIGNHRQVVEFDLGYEFLGLSTVPYIDINWLKQRLDYAISRRAVGAVLRVERMRWRAVDTPNQANIDVFTALLSDPAADAAALYKQWLSNRYGEKAMPHLYSAFMRTKEITDKSLFVLGFWISNHSLLPDYKYATGHLHWLTTAKWDPSYKDLEQELFSPTARTMRKIDAEKEKALVLVNRSIADIEAARPYLSQEDYAQLSRLFEREKAMVLVWKAGTEVIFGIDVYKATKSESDKLYLLQAADTLEALAQEKKDLLVEMASDYKSTQKTSNVDAALGLVELARKTVN